MKTETRRRLAALLIGAMSMLTALLVATMTLQARCLEAGGKWLAATRECAPGSAGTDRLSSGWAWPLGLAAGVVTGVVLWRAFAFFVVRAARRAHDSQ